MVIRTFILTDMISDIFGNNIVVSKVGTENTFQVAISLIIILEDI